MKFNPNNQSDQLPDTNEAPTTDGEAPAVTRRSALATKAATLTVVAALVPTAYFNVSQGILTASETECIDATTGVGSLMRSLEVFGNGVMDTVHPITINALFDGGFEPVPTPDC